MDIKYKLNPKKANKLFITTIVVFLTLETVSIIFLAIYGMFMLLACGFILYYAFFEIKQEFSNFKAILIMNETGLKSYRNAKNFVIGWEEINKIGYQGSAKSLLGEAIFIRNDKKYIFIDNFFEDYLDIWREVINECKIHNPDILIDERIEKRLSEYKAKKNSSKVKKGENT